MLLFFVYICYGFMFLLCCSIFMLHFNLTYNAEEVERTLLDVYFVYRFDQNTKFSSSYYSGKVRLLTIMYIIERCIKKEIFMQFLYKKLKPQITLKIINFIYRDTHHISTKTLPEHTIVGVPVFSLKKVHFMMKSN